MKFPTCAFRSFTHSSKASFLLRPWRKKEMVTSKHPPDGSYYDSSPPREKEMFFKTSKLPSDNDSSTTDHHRDRRHRQEAIGRLQQKLPLLFAMVLLAVFSSTSVLAEVVVDISDHQPTRQREAQTIREEIVESKDELQAHVVFEKVRFVLLGCNIMLLDIKR
jgi:hypothetical protein